MRILYVSQYFPPETAAPAVRVHEFSREWVRLGHQVTVLTAFPQHPTGMKAPGDRWVLTRRESLDGIEVQRTYVYATPNRGVVRRMMSYASFMVSAALLGTPRVRSCRPDVVIATSPQLLCAVAGYHVARSLRVPFVFEVRDLWPESVAAVGAMGDGPVLRGLKSLARLLYRKCDRIVTVGEGYAREIHKLYGVPSGKMAVVTNGIDTELFVPDDKENDIRREFGWDDRFVVLYIGTHGMAHGLHRVLEAAKALAPDKGMLFAFVGEGAEKDRLKRLAEGWRLPNVTFIDQQPRSRVPGFYAACDLGLVTLRDAPLFRGVLPSKILEFLAMERPVLLSVDGEAKKLVERAGGGEFVPPEDVPAMVAAVRRLARDRSKLVAMGREGRRHVVEHYDRRDLAAKYLGLLEEVCIS